jgi:hypothetical protein
MTIQRTGPKQVNQAVTRLQRERDLALRRVDELHEHYKKDIQKKDDAERRATLIGMEQRTNQVRDACGVVVNVINYKVNRQCVLCVLYRMCDERSESSVKRAK